MAQEQATRRQSTSKKILDELVAMRVALESIGQSIRLWVNSQGQPGCPVDDRVPDAIEQLAVSPDFGRRTSVAGAE
jgi:hypothetical protein